VLPWAKKKPNGRPYPKNNYSKKGARGLAQLVKGLTSKYKALRSNSSTTKKKKKKEEEEEKKKKRKYSFIIILVILFMINPQR
jgi:uncharacterized protein YqhQ